MPIKDYKDLKIWKMGIEIVDIIYYLTERFPDKERFCLIPQMQRSATSIPSNIAEGFARQYSKEYRQFLYISLGSCAELETQILIADKRKYLGSKAPPLILDKINQESRMLMCLIKLLRP